MVATIKKTTKFRDLLAGGTVVMPGVFNAISAKLVEEAGFSAYYISGAGLANAEFALPDIGVPTLEQAAEHGRRIDAAVNIPGISDVDTAFADPAACGKVFAATGLAGIHLEDQIEQKKCGHLDGKQLVSIEEMSERVAAVKSAAQDDDFMIIARTDAKAVEGLDAAIARCKAYVAAGADAIFPEAMQSAEDFQAMRKALDVPLLANMTEFGKTPYLTVQQFENLGYNMVIFPMTMFRVAAGAMRKTLAELKTTGTQQSFMDQMQTRDELYKLLNYQP